MSTVNTCIRFTSTGGKSFSLTRPIEVFDHEEA